MSRMDGKKTHTHTHYVITYSPETKEKGKLIFHLGYSHSIILEIPKEITVKFDKNIFSLMPANYGLLQNFATIIRSYRLPDPQLSSHHPTETRINIP